MLYVRDLHTDFRRRCVEHLKSHRDRLLDPFCPTELGVDGNEHLINMAKVDTYGEEYEIRAMEEIFDKAIEVRSISVISKELVVSSCCCLYPDEVGSEEPIMLSYHNKNHYNLLSKAKASTSRESEPVAYESYSSSNRILNFRSQIFKKGIDEGNPPVQKKSKLNN